MPEQDVKDFMSAEKNPVLYLLGNYIFFIYLIKSIVLAARAPSL